MAYKAPCLYDFQNYTIMQNSMQRNIYLALHEKCPYSEFFWSVFRLIRTEVIRTLWIRRF